jgi:hypothetical protein
MEGKMFIRIIKRQLNTDVAIDFKLLMSFRDEDCKTKHKHIKTWTIRNSHLCFRQTCLQFIEDVRWDLWQINEAEGQRAKLLNAVKKFFVLHGINPQLRRSPKEVAVTVSMNSAACGQVGRAAGHRPEHGASR